MIRIGIDVDNVMADFTEGFVKSFNMRTGKNLKGEDLLLKILFYVHNYM